MAASGPPNAFTKSSKAVRAATFGDRPARSISLYRRWLLLRRPALVSSVWVAWPAHLPPRAPGLPCPLDPLLPPFCIFVGIHVITPMLSDIADAACFRALFASYFVELSTSFAPLSLQLLGGKLQPIWYPGSRPGQRLFACEFAVMAHITTRYQAGPLGCAVQVRSCSSRLMTSWMNAMSSTTAKWAPSLMWTCRRELVKRPQPRACLRDT